MKSCRNLNEKSDRWVYFALAGILILILAERIAAFFELGADYYSHSDDFAYLQGGIYFAETGRISTFGASEEFSAMIMPGMPVLLGIVSKIFGQGIEYLVALKCLWIAMGVATAYAACITVWTFAPRYCGLFAAACFLIPNMAWINNLILTETPYMLLMILCIYYTFRMGESRERKYFTGYTVCFMLALMFRANILSMPVFTAIYLAIVRKKQKKFSLKRIAAFACAFLCFVIPWTIRNYIRFDAFVPITYGSGNPLLLGTYQGENYPEDDELDYSANVDKVMLDEYERFYTEEELERVRETGEYHITSGLKNPHSAQYLVLEADGIKARYRMKEWFRSDPGAFLKSYLYIKPRWMLNWSWAWEEVLNTPYTVLHFISQINFILCGITVLLSLLMKKCRKPVLFLSLVYFANVYIYATAFVSDRYASTIMVMRYIMMGFFVYLSAEAVRKLVRRNRNKA